MSMNKTRDFLVNVPILNDRELYVDILPWRNRLTRFNPSVSKLLACDIHYHSKKLDTDEELPSFGERVVIENLSQQYGSEIIYLDRKYIKSHAFKQMRGKTRKRLEKVYDFSIKIISDYLGEDSELLEHIGLGLNENNGHILICTQKPCETLKIALTQFTMLHTVYVHSLRIGDKLRYEAMSENDKAIIRFTRKLGLWDKPGDFQEGPFLVKLCAVLGLIGFMLAAFFLGTPVLD